MEWTVVGVIVVLVGLFFTVGKPIMGVVRELQTLRCDTDRQEKEIDRDIDSIKELVKLSQIHENRITNQEDKMVEARSSLSEVNSAITELLRVSQTHEARIHNLEDDVSEIKGDRK